METAIYIFQRIQMALGTLEIKSARSNLDTLLGCMQLCDKGIEALNNAITSANKSEDDKSINAAASAVSYAEDAKEVKEAS